MVGFKGGEENDQGGGSKIVMAKGNEEKFREDPGGYRVTVDEERWRIKGLDKARDLVERVGPRVKWRIGDSDERDEAAEYEMML